MTLDTLVHNTPVYPDMIDLSSNVPPSRTHRSSIIDLKYGLRRSSRFGSTDNVLRPTVRFSDEHSNRVNSFDRDSSRDLTDLNGLSCGDSTSILRPRYSSLSRELVPTAPLEAAMIETISHNITVPRRVEHCEQQYSNSMLTLCLTHMAFRKYNLLKIKSIVSAGIIHKKTLSRDRLANLLPSWDKRLWRRDKYEYKDVVEKPQSKMDVVNFTNLWLDIAMTAGL